MPCAACFSSESPPHHQPLLKLLFKASQKKVYFTKMSCNGCRVLRKGCSDTCILRSCLQWIESPEAQGHATVFVAKFFGRAGMMSFINTVAESERPALFQSLLYEACGRTVNPVFGAVGLLWSGNWGRCQAAVETVLKGGTLKGAASSPSTKLAQPLALQKPHLNSSSKRPQSMMIEGNMKSNGDKRFRSSDQQAAEQPELRCKADVAQVDHSVPVFLPNHEVNTFNNPACLASSEAFKQEQRPSPCGQLVAPVARRVKPEAGYGLAAMVIREHQQASLEQERPSHENVELDLSLNSNLHMIGRPIERREPAKPRADTHPDVKSNVDHVSFERSLCNEEENAQCLEAVRASSPCSFSMNSEGSVISSDTAEFSASCVRPYTSSALRHEECQLLHLL